MQRHMQTVSQKRHENVRLNAPFLLVKNRPNSQVSFQVLEGLFHLRRLNVELPQLSRILLAKIGA
jgi:hypothetical protein